VILLVTAAGAAAGNLPFFAIICLPILFAAGIGGIWDIADIDLSLVSYMIVGLFVVSWTLAIAACRILGIEEKWATRLQ
jgi:high-affinity nickel permease